MKPNSGSKRLKGPVQDSMLVTMMKKQKLEQDAKLVS
jgi:hypothetical protein